jgi:hypothetical protein
MAASLDRRCERTFVRFVTVSGLNQDVVLICQDAVLNSLEKSWRVRVRFRFRFRKTFLIQTL